MTDRYESLRDLLREVNKGIHDLVHDMAGVSDLGVASMILLGQLHGRPGSTISELARAVGLAKSHVSTTVEHLACTGMVEKRPDQNDLRLVRIWPTKRSGDQFDAINEMIREQLRGALADLPDPQIDGMIVGLQALHARLAQRKRLPAGGRLVAPPTTSMRDRGD